MAVSAKLCWKNWGVERSGKAKAEEAPSHSLGELINTPHESGGPHLNPLRW